MLKSNDSFYKKKHKCEYKLNCIQFLRLSRSRRPNFIFVPLEVLELC